jgi:hypothetical protein
MSFLTNRVMKSQINYHQQMNSNVETNLHM